MPRIDRLICFYILICMGCREKTNTCRDVVPNQYFHGKGYILYFNTSEDGMRDIWFFPICQKEVRPKSVDEFFQSEFNSGISFKMPISGMAFKRISVAAKEYRLKDSTLATKMYYCLSWIKINKPKNSTPQYSKGDKSWNLLLNLPDKDVKLTYFISNESNVESIEPLFQNN